VDAQNARFGDGHGQDGAPVVDRLAECRGLADRYLLGIIGLGSRRTYRVWQSRSSRLPLVGVFRRPAVFALACLLGTDGPADLPLR